jgi:6,7-dimethyl-8-ribityllumazine synthase
MAGKRRSQTGASQRAQSARILIVEARFYDEIADALLAGARGAIAEAGAACDVITVPGALEIPAAIVMALNAAAATGRPYDGVVALGCVIRGDTIHFEIVSQESARALMDLSVAFAVPLGNGILTVDTEEQAWTRARIEEADKGGDAARAALAMLAIKIALSQDAPRAARKKAVSKKAISKRKR